MRILHIVRDVEDGRALDVAQKQHRRGHAVTLLLLHDAVLGNIKLAGQVLACETDALARRRQDRYETVDYEDIVKMIFDYDRVISW